MSNVGSVQHFPTTLFIRLCFNFYRQNIFSKNHSTLCITNRKKSEIITTPIKCLPFKISFRCLNHELQWSSLKLFKWTAQSVSLFSSLCKHLKIVIPNKVPPFFCPTKRRRFSLTENTSFISIISSSSCRTVLESPVGRKKKLPTKSNI